MAKSTSTKKTASKKRATKKASPQKSAANFLPTEDGIALARGAQIQNYQAYYNPSNNSGRVTLLLSTGQQIPYNVDAVKLAAILPLLMHPNKGFTNNLIVANG